MAIYWFNLMVFGHILGSFIGQNKQKIGYYSVITVFAIIALFPLPTELGWAGESLEAEEALVNAAETESESIYPVIKEKQPKYTQKVRLTAYSSTVAQCDGNPFITASGTRVHDGTIAANCLAFGTKVKIPSLYGDKIFTVEDRLAPRMGCGTVDIWFPSTPGAWSFGSRYAVIEVY
ncbi:MAG: hypothetical protein WC752_02645 [Patescibacteria group bacterium]